MNVSSVRTIRNRPDRMHNFSPILRHLSFDCLQHSLLVVFDDDTTSTKVLAVLLYIEGDATHLPTKQALLIPLFAWTPQLEIIMVRILYIQDTLSTDQ